MLTKRLHVRLKSWSAYDYSESGEHDLDLYFWVGGRLAHHLNHKGPDHLQPVNWFGQGELIYPTVKTNRFKVRLVAIERDGPQWFDPDDVAKAEFEIDLDRDPPTSNWTIVAQDPRKTDLKVELEFNIEYLEYITENDITNYPYPWEDSLMLFQHWLGLGASVRVSLSPDKLIKTSKMLMKNIRTGEISTTTTEFYRFSRHQIGLADDSISSVYIPLARTSRYTVTLFEGDFSGRKIQLRTPGLHNMPELGFHDMASSMEIIRSYTETNSRPA